jgi:pimeloyl-ACP methyl ester carboxylesterase
MNPFFFGSSEKQLYGVYHPPRGRDIRETGILLCYPLGQEYMRGHRAFRQLSLLLSRAGYPVFRFDYFGTGDSAGTGEEAMLGQWLEDVGIAIEELKDTAGVTRVSLIGLRLGAALAALAAERREDIDRLVLWDPVVRGSDYVDELLAAPGAELCDIPPSAPSRPYCLGTIGVLGFPVTEELRAEFDTIDLCRLQGGSAREVLLFASSERLEDIRLRNALREQGAPTSYHHIPSPGNWNEVDNFGSALLPQAIIQGIVGTMALEARI